MTRRIPIQAHLIIDRRGMVTTSQGAKLFQVTSEGVLFLDRKDRRRVSERLGDPCVCISAEELVELLSRHCVERGERDAAAPNRDSVDNS